MKKKVVMGHGKGKKTIKQIQDVNLPKKVSRFDCSSNIIHHLLHVFTQFIVANYLCLPVLESLNLPNANDYISILYY